MNVKLLIDNLYKLERHCNMVLLKPNATLINLDCVLELVYSEYIKIKQELSLHQFTSEEEQINFFKIYNSQLIKLCLYYNTTRKIESSLLHQSLKRQFKILKEHLAEMDVFTSQSKDFIVYINTESTHYDQIYFTQNPKVENKNLFYSFERDPDFSTHHSFLLGKVLSTLMTYQYIDNKLEALKSISSLSSITVKTEWKKSKTDFVELVYAIHASGAVDLEISKLFELFNQVIKTGPLDEFNKWNNIKNRANSQPRFIPQLLKDLQAKINQDFE
jgi:hypothetical protein